MKEKALNYLGLMRKANAIEIGEKDTGSAVHAGKAKLVLLASDASGNAAKRAETFVFGRNVPLVTVPFTKEEISNKVGKSGCSMAAVCDAGFAAALLRTLTALSPDYAPALERIEHGGHGKNARGGRSYETSKIHSR